MIIAITIITIMMKHNKAIYTTTNNNDNNSNNDNDNDNNDDNNTNDNDNDHTISSVEESSRLKQRLHEVEWARPLCNYCSTIFRRIRCV